MPQDEITPEMSFDDAFVEAVEADPAAADADAFGTLDAEPATAPAEVVVEAPAEPTAPDAPTEVVVEAPGEAPAAPATPQEPSSLSNDDAAELARLRAAEADWRKAQTPADETPPAAAAEPPDAEPVLSAADRARIEEYQTDWPDIAQAEALLRKEMSDSLKAEVYTAVGQVLQHLYGMVQPLLADHAGNSISKREATITARIPEYTQLKAGVTAWTGTQPAPVAKAYKEILDTGSVEDVFKVVSLYKQAVGKTTPQTTPPTAPPAAPALEPVSIGRRTAPASAVESNPNDFVAGWMEAVKSL